MTTHLTQPSDQASAEATDRTYGRAAVRSFVLGLNPGLDPAELRDDTPLVTTRLVTSRDILDLLLLVESLRRRPIDPRTLVASTFADIDAIVRALLSGTDR